MAAGRGSRYGQPKQFDPIGPSGEFLLEYGLYDAVAEGFTHLVLIVQEDRIKFLTDYLRPKIPAEVQLDILAQDMKDLPVASEVAGERTKPWGTAHAVWTARTVIASPFAICNADDFYGAETYRAAAHFLNHKIGATTYGLVGFLLQNTLSINGSVSRGICKLEGTHLVEIKEHLRLKREEEKIIDVDTRQAYSGQEAVSMNFWMADLSIFDYLSLYIAHFLQKEEGVATEEIYIPSLIGELCLKNQIEVLHVPSKESWFGLTYAEDREATVATLLAKVALGIYPTPLWANEN